MLSLFAKVPATCATALFSHIICYELNHVQDKTFDIPRALAVCEDILGEVPQDVTVAT